MGLTAYLEYTIHLTDKAQVDALQAGAPWCHLPRNEFPGSIGHVVSRALLNQIGDLHGVVFAAPDAAAGFWSAPVVTTAGAFQAPCITSPYIQHGDQQNLPTDVDSFDKTRGTWFALAAEFPEARTFVWMGRFALAGALVESTEPIAQRKFIESFDMPEQGAGGSGVLLNFSRGASRHADGFGLAIRGTEGILSHATDKFGAALERTSMERLYIRLVKAPTGDVTFWRCRGSISNAAGVQLIITSTKRIKLCDTNPSNVQSEIGTVSDALDLRKWYRLDLLFGYRLAADFRLFLSTVEKLTVAFSSAFGGIGADNAQNHASSEVGAPAGSASKGLGLDICDWSCMSRPTLLVGNDFKNGSRVRRINPTGFAASHGAYVGDWRALLQMPVEDASALLSSSTNADTLAVTTDAVQAIDGEPGSLGPVAMVVGMFHQATTGAPDGDLGYSINGDAPVLATVVENSTAKWNSVMYRPSGLFTPAPITPIELVHTKAANTELERVYAMMAAVELIGVWGKEDVAPTTAGVVVDPRRDNTGIHNAPYPRTPWAKAGVAPIAPVLIVGGTYVGNDLGTTLTFRTPVHALWIRHVNNAHGGSWWFSSAVAAHKMTQLEPRPAGMTGASIDPAFDDGVAEDAQGMQTILHLAGTETDVNADAETYQYVAFCDPGMRFLINDVLAYPAGTADQTTPLKSPNFLAEVLFLMQETMNGGTTAAAFFKGLGHATQEIQNLEGTAPTATALTISRGSLLSKSNAHFSPGLQILASLWRRDDGSADPGLANVFWLSSYTGNATSPRTLDIELESTVRPLYAIVQPHNAAAVFRDPSHTGTTSTTFKASASASNGIRGGGIGQLIVGSDLNANGIVYDVFVICGGATAGNGGFSENGEFIPVVPAVPESGGPFDDPPEDDLDFSGEGDGGDGGGGDGDVFDEFGAECIAPSTKIIHKALSFAGSTKQIADVTTELTVEAGQARLHYEDDVLACLQEFDWPFATKYLALTLVDGDEVTPANDDWQYAYRVPTDCVRARRVVKPGQARKPDPDPIQFRRGNDTDGDLIYTNQPDAVLEYTRRPSCAASAGGPLFRRALTWRHCSSLAMAIARDKKKQGDAWQMYLHTLGTATTRDANEAQKDPKDVDADWITGRE